jgi:HEPN pEK499 p136
MNYKVFVKDFAERTVANLRIIRDSKKEDDNRFEITQLINSLLGLIVFPHEKLDSDIPQHSFDRLESMGWPLFKVEPGDDNTGCNNLRLLIENLRNGIAHGKFDFYGQKHIESVTITNDWNGKRWKGTIGVGNLRRFVESFATELVRVCEKKEKNSGT